MARPQNWEQLLREYFVEANAKPFEWGQHDCCLFASGAVTILMGKDFAEDARGQYSDADTAKAYLKTKGVATPKGLASKLLGRAKHVAQAKRGDVVLYQGSLGICCGSFSRFIGTVDEAHMPVIADGSEQITGLVSILTSACDCAWTVPF